MAFDEFLLIYGIGALMWFAPPRFYASIPAHVRARGALVPWLALAIAVLDSWLRLGRPPDGGVVACQALVGTSFGLGLLATMFGRPRWAVPPGLRKEWQ